MQPYTPLTNIGNFVSATPVDFPTYLNSMYKLGIAAAGVLAVIMIVVGGIQYMTSEAIGSKEEGKDRIWSAIWGLVLALMSFIILNTINPKLLNLNLSISQVNGTAGTPATANNQLFATTTGTAGVNPYTGYNALTGAYGLPGQAPTADSLSPAPGGGQTATVNNVKIDTDGIGQPPYFDLYHQNQTSYQPNGQSLDANTDVYVVVPIGSSIPLGTPVLIQDNTTGKQVWGIVGDHGPSTGGYGEMSRAAGMAIGATDGTRDAANPDNVTFTFYP
ncbi:MAG: pilin [Candidatus Pacebacteria bacterium]|nr:pilin [Candidatus Paceibacterota bacterium]